MKKTESMQEKLTKILIINLHSSRNNGDAALTKVAVQQLYENFPNSQITLAMNDPDSHTGKETKVGSFLYWVHRPSKEGGMRWHYLTIIKIFFASLLAIITYRLNKNPFFLGINQNQKKTLKSYFDSDLVVSAPGNFIYSSGKAGLSLLIITYTMFYAIMAGKPLYLFPQSIGPLRRERDRKLVKWVLNRARIVMVREPVSLKEIQNIGVTNPNCLLIPDVAFAFKGAPTNETIRWLNGFGIFIEKKQPLLGITVINWGAQTSQPAIQTRYESAIFDAAKFFLEATNGKVIFFPQVCGSAKVDDDRIPAQRIVEQMPEYSNRVIFIEQITNPELLRTAYQLMDIFIGTRMHSNIFALSGGVPVIAIAYRHKTQGIMQMVGLEEWTVDIDKITGVILIDKFVRLWKERKSVRNHIEAKAVDLAIQAQQAGTKVATDYKSFSNQPQ